MSTPSSEFIMQVVAKHYGVTPVLIRSANRHESTVLARSVFAYMCRELTAMSLNDIGRELHGRHHTTVLEADRRVRRRMPSDPMLAQSAELIRSIIAAGPPDEAAEPLTASLVTEIQRLRMQMHYAAQIVRETKTDIAKLENMVRAVEFAAK